ncbi:hypothetical protein AN214_03503 [Pseudoalteromonas sp. P1-9]|uniref:hypothetical protein n=1 Tax=Pseudoalteromonas sp. P1-9 TaxID=1710354 RepID=UPI0006D6353A|nr:hypothetical protein [Pseudoalteromonas sp. P1-9]KPV94488.1 hypothetical protein AN214_03503 [Pseudoalteromonas sp. P1-9]
MTRLKSDEELYRRLYIKLGEVINGEITVHQAMSDMEGDYKKYKSGDFGAVDLIGLSGTLSSLASLFVSLAKSNAALSGISLFSDITKVSDKLNKGEKVTDADLYKLAAGTAGVIGAIAAIANPVGLAALGALGLSMLFGAGALYEDTHGNGSSDILDLFEGAINNNYKDTHSNLI